MEYQKIINLLDDKPNQLSRFRTKMQVQINDDVRGKYNANSQIKFKRLMLKANLFDQSDAYIVAIGTITVEAEGITIYKQH